MGGNKRLVHVKEMYRGNVGMSMGNERVRDVTETLSGSRRRVGGATERERETVRDQTYRHVLDISAASICLAEDLPSAVCSHHWAEKEASGLL